MAPQTPKSSLTSGSQKSPRPPKFSWSPRHRQALFVFHKRNLNDDQIAFAFNQMFRREIAARGFPSGLNKSSIKAQFNKSYRVSCPAWQEVESSRDVELEWVSRAMEKLDVIGSPLPSPTSTSPRVQKAAATRKPAQLVSVVIEQRPQTSVVPSRNVFKSSPRSMITYERTRTVNGKQVPIIRATDEDLVVENPVMPGEAHSAVPELLFRSHDKNSQGVRRHDGEICGRYAYLPCAAPGPPSCSDDRMFAAALSHLNRDEIASELISTTSNLFFAMRLAAKSNAEPHICVIRSSAMPNRKIFHLWPYHLRFKALRLYYNGKYRNPSSHEYAIWATIPQKAIIAKLAFADFERHIIGNPYIAPIFRMNEMTTTQGNTGILKKFKKDKPDLTLATIEGIARLMPKFGITVTSSPPVIARFISELVRSFEIDLPKTTPTQWDILGGAFAFALSYHGDKSHVDESYLIAAKEAFLSGMRTGIGELNWHLNPTKQAKMIKKGLSLGLGVNQAEIDPARLESNKNSRTSIAKCAYKGKGVELEQDTMDEDDTLLDDEDEDDDPFVEITRVHKRPMPTTTKKTQSRTVIVDDDVNQTDIEEHTENDEEEVETDIEESAVVRTPPQSQRSRISYAREASHSGKKINEKFIIFDCSDDEDYVVDSEMV
jgi:hypothetical protein